MNVLIVDCEHGISNCIADLLCEHGFNALPLYDPTEAVEHAELMIFDVAFLGIQNPSIIGAHLQLRLQQLLPLCRFVLFGTPEAVESAKRLGHDFEYLCIPFGGEAFLKIAQEVETDWANYENEILERSYLSPTNG